MPTRMGTRCSSRSGIRSSTVDARKGRMDSEDGRICVSASKILKPFLITFPLENIGDRAAQHMTLPAQYANRRCVERIRGYPLHAQHNARNKAHERWTEP